MLIIKAFISGKHGRKEIAEIFIHNVKTISEEHGGIYEYRIEIPKGYKHIPIYHNHSNGWKSLAIDALKVLEDSNEHG